MSPAGPMVLTPSGVPLTSATLTIDLGAIVENWRLLKRQGRRGIECAAVVKADAYGLGAGEVASALYLAGCRHFFVALLEEGRRLRSRVPADATIFVLHGVMPGTEQEFAVHRLTPVLNSLEQIACWRALAQRLGQPLPAALQVDTGMARVGLSPADAQELDEAALAGCRPVLLMSHLVAAEEPGNPINLVQLERFKALRNRLPAMPASLANSSGVFLGHDWHFDLLRPGAALYGVSPTVGQANPLRPALRLQVPLIQWRDVNVGDGVGYNHTWIAKRPTRVGTLSVGYADGYLRSFSNRAWLTFRGHQVPLIGRVSMDTITVDLSELPLDALQPGAAFDLIHAGHDINALALEAGTNAYEILTSLGSRYRRQYIDT